MKASEILRQLADVIAQAEGGDAPSGEITNRPDMEIVEPVTQDQAEVTTMVPPMQQELEILKQVDAMSADTEFCDEPEDEVIILKRAAGLGPQVYYS